MSVFFYNNNNYIVNILNCTEGLTLQCCRFSEMGWVRVREVQSESYSASLGIEEPISVISLIATEGNKEKEKPSASCNNEHC